jgi:hypothetical protein
VDCAPARRHRSARHFAPEPAHRHSLRRLVSCAQALRYLGKTQVDEQVLSTIRRQLDDKDKAQLIKDIKYAPAWVGGILRQLATKTS